jgi:hypothetical protein
MEISYEKLLFALQRKRRAVNIEYLMSYFKAPYSEILKTLAVLAAWEKIRIYPGDNKTTSSVEAIFIDCELKKVTSNVI